MRPYYCKGAFFICFILSGFMGFDMHWSKKNGRLSKECFLLEYRAVLLQKE